MKEEIAEKYLSWKQEQKAGPKGSVFFALYELLTAEKEKVTMWTRDHTLGYCESDG